MSSITTILKKIKVFFFQNTSTRQTVAKNAFWLAVSNFGGRFIRGAIVIYAARVLGPSEWGVFNYTITIVTFLTLFVDSGINQILIRDRSQADHPEEKRTKTATAFYLKLILLAIGTVVIIVFAPLLPTADAFTAQKAAVLFPIMALIMTFDAIREFFHAILRSEERMEWETVSYGLTNIWIVIFGFILLAMHPTVRGFTVAYAAGTALGALGAAIISRKYLRDIWGGFSGAVMRKLMHSIWPYTISSALGMLMINTDIIMLGWFRSSTEVGWYSAPQRIVQLIYLIPSVISVSILPTFSRLAAQSREKMTRAIEQGVSVMYMAALPVAVGGIIVAIPFTQLLFGPAFTPGAVAFQILLLSLLADFSAVLLSNALLAQHRQKKLIIYSAIGGSLNVGLNLLLIPKFGLAGCAVATLGAQIVSNSYLQYTVRQIHPFHIWRHLRGAVLGTFAMALTVFFLQMQGAPVVLNIAIGALIYGGVLVLRRDPLVQELQQGVMGNLTPQSLASTAPASRESNAG